MADHKHMKINRILKLIGLIMAAVVLFTIAACSASHRSSYNISYRIRPLISGEDTGLQVVLKLEGLIPKTGGYLALNGAGMPIKNVSCRDKEGEELPVEESSGLVFIKTGERRYVEISYGIKLGDVGKHGHHGAIYEDLAVFDGGEALLLPAQALSGTEEEIKRIGEITISCDAPKEWVKVMPIEKIEHPSWNQFYILKGTCFAFGKLHKNIIGKDDEILIVYTDSKDRYPLTDEAKAGLTSIYRYYKKLFGYHLSDFSLILLRDDSEDGLYIIGGASAKSIGSTFDPGNPRDWQLMSHRMFHAFFDTGEKSRLFYEAPQLWFYEGLATYYESSAMDSLPGGLQERLGLKSDELFGMLFRQYVYMKLKDPALLSLAPMNEVKINKSPARMEFLHYYQAPLTIKAMEDISYRNTGVHDRILKYIMGNRKKDEPLTIKNIINYALDGESEEFIRKYLFSDEFLPLWYLEDKNPDSLKVISGLNSIEKDLWSWFICEVQGYPLDELSLDRLKNVQMVNDIENVNFGEESIEKKVKKLSPEIYFFLKEYALRAKVCGVEFEDPQIRFKLLGDEKNVKRWKDYMRLNINPCK